MGKGLDDIPMADFPEILLARHGNNNHKPPFKELYKGATEGRRNDRLARLTGSLVRDGLSQEDCLEFAYTWNTRNNPPLPEREIEQTVASIYSRDKVDKGDIGDVPAGSENNILNEIPVPEFPLDVFPPEFQQYVSSASNSIGIDTGAYTTMAMATLSSCIGNSTKIYTKRDFGVTPFLWVAIAIRTGSGKSPALVEATKPLKMMQSASYRVFQQKMEIYEREFDAYRKDKKGTTNRPLPPVLNHLYVSDATVESLADVFESQPRGVLNIQDELSGFIMGLNQYKKNGNDKQQFLSIYNCDSMKIDRKGRNRVIPNTGMAIVGGIQPGVLPKVFEEDSFIDGFIQRFLFVYPNSTTPAEFSRHSIPDDEQQYWGRMVNWFLEIPLEMHEMTGMVKPMAITLSPEALDRWIIFYNEYAHLQTVLPERLAGFLPKLHLYSLKLALILHAMEGFTKHRHIVTEVTEVTVIHAIKLTNYFLGQVKKITKIYGGKKEVNEQQQRLLQALYNLKENVTNGGLQLQFILEEYNKGLPDYIHLTPEGISNILRKDLGFTTKKGKGNHSFLLWDETKLNSLYRETVTTVTTVTKKTDDEPFNGQF